MTICMKATTVFLGVLLCLSSVLKGAENGQTKENPYLFFFFYKEKNARTGQQEKIFDETLHALNVPIQSFKINISDPNQKTLVAKYGVERAPMPMALVVSPEGAITGGFPYIFTQEQLNSAIIAPNVSKVLGGLQNRKLVFLCMQNDNTKSNELALRGVRDLERDPRFLNAIEIVMMDPSDERDQNFLKQFDVNLDSAEAQTVLLAPPGDKINTYSGATHKEQFVTDLQKAVSGCCPGGCCPGGCCPGGRCGK